MDGSGREARLRHDAEVAPGAVSPGRPGPGYTARVPPHDPDETFDVVDEADRVVGRATRAAVHRRGLRHRAAHVFLFDGAGRLYLQRRSLSKDENPGLWDSSAAGPAHRSRTSSA